MEYFEKRFEDKLNNKKETWKCINKVLYNGKKAKVSSEIFDKTATKTEKLMKINIFNTYFASIGKQLTDNFDNTNQLNE